VTAMAHRAIAAGQGGRLRSFSVDFANHGTAFVAGDFHKSSDTPFVRISSPIPAAITAR